jgi:hypothetical protein
MRDSNLAASWMGMVQSGTLRWGWHFTVLLLVGGAYLWSMPQRTDEWDGSCFRDNQYVSQSTLGDSNQLQFKFWSADDSFYARADMGRGADASGQSPWEGKDCIGHLWLVALIKFLVETIPWQLLIAMQILHLISHCTRSASFAHPNAP